MNELLEKAKAYNIKTVRANNITDEQIEVALAYLKGELTLLQATFAITNKATTNAHRMCNILLEAYQRGKIVIK